VVDASRLRVKGCCVSFPLSYFFRSLEKAEVKFNSIDKAPAHTPWVRGTRNVKILELVVVSFGMDSILLREGSIQDPFYKILEQLRS